MLVFVVALLLPGATSWGPSRPRLPRLRRQRTLARPAAPGTPVGSSVMERLTDIGRRATTLGFKETESLLEARLKETEEYRKALDDQTEAFLGELEVRAALEVAKLAVDEEALDDYAAILSAEALAAVDVKPRKAFRSRRLWAAGRTASIWRTAVSFGWRVARQRRKFADKQSADAVAARGALTALFRDALLDLGPTFIKFGQLLSTRVDVLPPEVAIVKEELGINKLDEVFASFDATPLTAASLAQVHAAEGRTESSSRCSDGLVEQFDVDCKNIRFLASVADRVDPENEGVSSNWRGIADTSEGVLYREIDFLVERDAAERFRRAFEEGAGNAKPLPWVKVPKTFDEYCTSRVLVMEYVPGTKINDVPALEKMDSIEPDVKKGFVDLVYSLYKNQPITACDALEQMGVLRPGLDRYSIERIATNYVKSFASTVDSKNAGGVTGLNDGAKWETEMSEEEERAARRERRAQIGKDLFATQAERPFVFPPKFTFIFRAITTIDGIGNRYKTGVLELLERVGWRPIDVNHLVTAPRRLASTDASIKRIEAGDLTLRTRSVELEAQLTRVEARQRMFQYGTVAALALRLATEGPALALAEAPLKYAAQKAYLLGAAWAAAEGFGAYCALCKLDKNQRRFRNELDDC
ncbi:hypothetical protein JL721_11314 [Aureococcus anophagefferens]|nr:hypothetical protein JL721_11314 [Aureococcus anophagefferens]